MLERKSLEKQQEPSKFNSLDDDCLVDLKNISVVFDNTNQILHNINFTINKGEFVSLIGRSGCGKTTLLKIISGLLTPTSGSIKATAQQAIGFQDARLIPWMRVGNNVIWGMSGKKRELKDLASHALSIVQLDGYERKWPSQLSGGQAQRVSLARALVHNPKLLLLDEPFGALDALTRLDMQNMLADLRSKHNWTVVMVTHDIAEAVRLSDRILMVKNGAIKKQWDIDRNNLDEQNRPIKHSEIEDELRVALQ